MVVVLVLVMLLTVVKLVLDVVARLMVAVGADAAHDLHSLGAISLVHGAKLVAAASHAIRSHGL